MIMQLKTKIMTKGSRHCFKNCVVKKALLLLPPSSFITHARDEEVLLKDDGVESSPYFRVLLGIEYLPKMKNIGMFVRATRAVVVRSATAEWFLVQTSLTLCGRMMEMTLSAVTITSVQALSCVNKYIMKISL